MHQKSQACQNGPSEDVEGDIIANTLRIGIVGAGANSRRHHVPKLQAIDGVEVVAVSNRSRASAQRVAEDFGITRVHDSWTALVDDDIDAVVIGTWPDMHARVTIGALEAGRHVLCEARMSRDAVEARAMIGAADKNPHLVAQLVPAPTTLPIDDQVCRLLSDGAIGDIVSVEVTARTGFADRDGPLTWRQRRATNGVNILSLGIWYEQLVRWVGEAARVSAFGQTLVPRRRDEEGHLRAVEVPDHVDVIGELAGGGQLRMVCSQAAGDSADNGVRILGTAGELHVLSGEQLVLRRPGKDPYEEAANGAGWRVEQEFVGAIRGTEPVQHTTFDDGLRYMRFTEAVRRSIDERRQVAIAEV
ncbi:Myo-inositol 2-dehydrogenase 1 [Frigoribacterium sp. JB110]|nr:Myo-inositol 2-dehydrogenase 1 [Frigoribacterium sp. JB110]